jgi:hypothetical protein
MKGRKENQVLSRGGYQWEREGEWRGLRRVTMVDVFVFMYEI